MTTRRYPSGIVGLPYPNKDGVLCRLVATSLSTGDEVQLRRDASNPAYPEAVAVYCGFDRDELHVGFVPARHAGWIGEALASGRAIVATVGEIHRNAAGAIVNVDLDVDVERAARRA